MVIDAFIDIKMLSIFLLLKGMTTVRANKSNGLLIFSIDCFVLFEQLLVIQLLELFNYRKPINSKFIILGACKIPLRRLDRYVFHYKKK